MLKIFYVITGLGVGGAERQLVDIADQMQLAGHEVKIIYLTGSALVKPKCADIEILSLDVKKSVFGLISAYSRLRDQIRRFKPDVVHSHMVHANILVRLVRLSVHIPRLVCTAHSTNEGGWLRMLAYRLTHRLADVTTNVSHVAVDAFEAKGAVPRGGMLAVTNGIDTDRFRPLLAKRIAIRANADADENEKIIIAVGRLNEVKNYSNLLHAYSRVLQKKANTRLWIIGDGPLRDSLVKQANDLRLNENVFFLGTQHNVEDWLNAADVFVLSSAWEGFGLVVAEAMATEKVVVATNAGGVAEVLGDCGFLVSTFDSEALSQALIKALNLSPAEAIHYGIKSRKRVVSEYSLDAVVIRWHNLYGSNLN